MTRRLSTLGALALLALGATAQAAGPDIGDADLDSDSDRNGTGERGAAGRDGTLPVDTIPRDESDRVIDGEALGDEEDESPDDASS